ncbi:MAG: hypothetical protein ABH807_00045 [Candidatus Shapirobacteria bacterium]
MKLLPKIFGLLIIFSFYFFVPKKILAACSPPQDYSGCSISQTGPKIAGNINIDNYAQIRELYNQANPDLINQQIPVTIIYTVEDLKPAYFNDAIGNLQAMQKNGLIPVIRLAGSMGETWNPITTEEAQTSAQTLNRLFSQLRFYDNGQAIKPVVYFGNEPNLPSEWGGTADANSFAQAFAGFIEAAGSSRTFQIFVPPVATHQGGVEYNFMQTILNQKLTNGQTIAASVDGVALTIYNDSPRSLATLYQELTNFYQTNGVKNNFIISEVGPLINGNLLQNENDQNAWVSRMSQVFAELKNNPQLFGEAEFISTSFFLDTDGDGFPNETLLVIIDKNGQVQIYHLKSLGGGRLGGTGSACKANINAPPKAITKGESFIVTINKCDSVAQKITGMLKTLKLDISDNKKIADDYKDPLMRLSPYNEIPKAEKTQKRLTSKGEITFEYCEKDQYQWPTTASSNITFEMPDWVWGWAAQSQITARYLNPATDPLKQLLVDNPSGGERYLAQGQAEAQVLGEQNQNTCPVDFYVSFENIRVENGALQYGVRISHTAPGWLGDIMVNPQLGTHYEKIGPGASIYLDTTYSGAEQFLPAYPANADPKTIQVDLDIRDQGDYQQSLGCSKTLNFNNGKSTPRPTPTPPKCVKYVPAGKTLNPFEVRCVAGSCLLTTGGSWIENWVTTASGVVEKILQFACGKQELVVTPIFKLPFLDEVNRYNNNTMGIFKTVSEDADQAFKPEDSLQDSTHQGIDGVEGGNQIEVDAPIFQQAENKAAWEWVTEGALQPYTGN